MAVSPVQRARELRRRMSLPETLIWVRIRRNDLHFRRQHPVPPYTLDFYCEAARLAVEVDGSMHQLSVGRDMARDDFLAREGIYTLRVSASEVLRDPDAVAFSVIGLARERIEGGI